MALLDPVLPDPLMMPPVGGDDISGSTRPEKAGQPNPIQRVTTSSERADGGVIDGEAM